MEVEKNNEVNSKKRKKFILNCFLAILGLVIIYLAAGGYANMEAHRAPTFDEALDAQAKEIGLENTKQAVVTTAPKCDEKQVKDKIEALSNEKTNYQSEVLLIGSITEDSYDASMEKRQCHGGMAIYIPEKDITVFGSIDYALKVYNGALDLSAFSFQATQELMGRAR